MIAALRPVLISFTLRTVLLWILTRITITAFFQAAAAASVMPSPSPAPGVASALSVAPPTAIVIAAAVAALVLNDVRVMRERAFLANIGVGLRVIGAFAFAGALSLEVVLGATLMVVQ